MKKILLTLLFVIGITFSANAAYNQFSSDVNMAADLTVGSDLSVLATLNITGESTFFDDVDMSSDVSIDGDLSIGKHLFADDQLGDWASRTVGTIYQASSDGFVVAAVDRDGSTDPHYIRIKSDGSNPPTTLRAEYQLNHAATQGNDHWSVCTLVKKDDYFKAEMSSGDTQEFMYFIPLD